MFLDADADAKEKGKDRRQRRSPPRSQQQRDSSHEQHRGTIHRMADKGVRSTRDHVMAALRLDFHDRRCKRIFAKYPRDKGGGEDQEREPERLPGKRHSRWMEALIKPDGDEP